MAASIRISDLKILSDGGEAVLSARVDARRLGCRGERLWFRMPSELAPYRAHGDPFVVALMLPAMVAGVDLTVDGPLSPSLRHNLDTMQEMLVGWNAENAWTRFRPIRLNASSHDEASFGGTAAGLFFSGGLDSMASLVRAETETGRSPDALLFVHGFDVPLEAQDRIATVLHHVRGTARLTGRRLIVVRTNLRRFTDPALHWEMAHGAGLAAAGHALGAGFDAWFISASEAHFRGGHPSGTTNGLDSLWSRKGLRFTSVGSELDRQMKSDLLAGEPFVQRHLVVCWKARPGEVNCGRCAKCVRAMLNFLVTGALHKIDTLPHRVTPDLLSAETMLPQRYRIVHWEAMIERLSARAEWAPLIGPVEALIDRSKRVTRPPRPWDLVTREGWVVAAEWLRSNVRRRMPVAVRRRVLPVYHHWRTWRDGR